MLGLEFNTRQLCMDLLHADTEEKVIKILAQHGYWDNPNAWRTFGNRPDNFSTIGNQSRSVSEYSLRPTMYIMHIVLWYE